MPLNTKFMIYEFIKGYLNKSCNHFYGAPAAFYVYDNVNSLTFRQEIFLPYKTMDFKCF